MSKVITTTFICNACLGTIKESDINSKEVISARRFSVHLHTECFKPLTAFDIISILRLDDITIGTEPLMYKKELVDE